MEERSLVPDGVPFKGESLPEPDYRRLPGWVVWKLAEAGFGHGLYYDDSRAGLCCWCKRPGADYRNSSYRLCFACACRLGHERPWYVPICRRCQHPLMLGAAMGVWCSPSDHDARLCVGCEAGWLRVGPDEFCHRLVATAADGARLFAQLLLEQGRERADVLKAAESALWTNAYLYEALRLQRVSTPRLVAQVREIAVAIVDDFEKSIDAIGARDRRN